MEPLTLQHVLNMRVVQAGLHKEPPDTKWYITTANGFVVRGPFTQREHAETALRNRIAHVERELEKERE